MPQYLPVTHIGSSFIHTACNNAASTTLIAAASNTGGMVLRWLGFTHLATGNCGVYVSPTAPTGVADTTRRRIALSWSGTIAYEHMQFPLFIPAGEGLFAFASAAGMFVTAGYDLY